MVANRTREMRLSGMTRGAYGNVNYGQGQLRLCATQQELSFLIEEMLGLRQF